jgi:branched-chain amino acid transport system substrate-binding protein
MMKISLKIKSLMASVAVSAAVALGGLSAQAANETLKIGFVGVTSGPTAAWGT